jgi:hypothetical protein
MCTAYDEAWQKMIDFIDMSDRRGESAIRDDMAGLAIILSHEMKKNNQYH